MTHSRRAAMKTLVLGGASRVLCGEGSPVRRGTVRLGAGCQANLFFQTSGIGLSCWRFNIGSAINPQITNSWRTAETTRQANERWFLSAAKKRAIPRFLASEQPAR